jgi:hypothetical protein
LLADLCAREGIASVLGHALDMRVIHGAKAKNDQIDSRKLAALRGQLMPQAYAYPAETRATRVFRTARRETKSEQGESPRRSRRNHPAPAARADNGRVPT